MQSAAWGIMALPSMLTRHVAALVQLSHAPGIVRSKALVVACLGVAWVAVLILWMSSTFNFEKPDGTIGSVMYYLALSAMGALGAFSAQLLLADLARLPLPWAAHSDQKPTQHDMSDSLVPFDANASTIGAPRIAEVIMTGDVNLSPLLRVPWEGVTVGEAAHAYLKRFRWPDADPDHGLLLRIEERQRCVLPGGVLCVRRRLHFSLDAVPWAARRFLQLDAAWADEELLLNPAENEATAHIVLDSLQHIGEYHCYSTIHADKGGAGGVILKSRMQVRGHSAMARSFMGSLLPPPKLGQGLQKELDTIRTAWAAWQSRGGVLDVKGIQAGDRAALMSVGADARYGSS